MILIALMLQVPSPVVRTVQENATIWARSVTWYPPADENRDSPERDMVNPSSEDSYMWPIRGAL